MAGPICSARVGDGWIDLGTACRTRTGAPGPAGVTEELVFAGFSALSPFKKMFDRDHVYSKAPEAARKRSIDLMIIHDDYSRSAEIRIDNEAYLKELIRIASNGKKQVSIGKASIQFFIVRGGAEGLFPVTGRFALRDMDKSNADNMIFRGAQNTRGVASDYHFDLNDLLVVFKPDGTLIGAARLLRPTVVPSGTPEKTEEFAKVLAAIYNSWDKKQVGIYRNKHPPQDDWVEYLALAVADGYRTRVDMHKEEATDGCMFIEDKDTPSMINHLSIDRFEPKLIMDILAFIHKVPSDIKPWQWMSLGTMHVIDIL